MTLRLCPNPNYPQSTSAKSARDTWTRQVRLLKKGFQSELTVLHHMLNSLFFSLSPLLSALGRKKKKGHGESVIPPRSLFDKASLLKVRREGKDQKKNFSLKQQAPFAKPLPSLLKPAMEAGQDNPEWLISEDWALLQVLDPSRYALSLPMINRTVVCYMDELRL